MGEVPNPYHVWLSEVMLQQTTVPAVIPYFLKFIDRWPDVKALANAHQDEVMSAWAGLGYYARARNLYKCAGIVADIYDGKFPCDIVALRALPGIGDYTSAAIMAIAFDRLSCVVDGNIERIFARYHTVEVALPKAKTEIKALADMYSSALDGRYGDYAQSLMDLGSGVCSPKSPKCALCPLKEGCKGYALGVMEDYPKRLPKKDKPQKYGYTYWIEDCSGRILLHKRPEKGLLGGLYGLPTSSWEKDIKHVLPPDFLENIPYEADGSVSHVFTHFFLKLYICRITGFNYDLPLENHRWVEKKDLPDIGFPSLFEKVRKMRA